MQIHELNTLSNKPVDTDFLAIDTGFDTAKISAPKLLEPKINRPLDGGNQYDDGTAGQLLRTKGDGSTEWSDVGLPTDEQTAQAVSDWLDAHPEATTTVLDGSITMQKFAAALQAALATWSDLGESGRKLKFIAGAIRNSGTGWQFISDANHEPLNLTGITVSTDAYGNITINYGFTAKRVLSLVVCPDETFSKLYTIGGSVGLSETVLTIYTLPKIIGGYIAYSGSSWNRSLSSFTNAVFNNGVLTLSHESIVDWATADKFYVNATGRDCNVQLGGASDDSLELKFLNSSGNVKTTEDSSMKAYVTRHAPSRQISANSIVNASGNFWIFGVMEIN